MLTESPISLRDVLIEMGVPKAIASDDGGEFKGRFKEILDVEGVDHIIMTTHLSFIDRFTRTIKICYLRGYNTQ